MLVGESNQDLYYLLKWESLAEREQKFSRHHRCRSGRWLQERAETEKNGAIVASVTNQPDDADQLLVG